MRAQVFFDFRKRDFSDFTANCEAAIRNINRGTKTATIQACKEILAASLLEVPRDTQTLANSAFYEVQRRQDVSPKSYVYQGRVGYGGNGDPVNPWTGRPASSYMVAVHERLDVNHRVGKAKFLEDPVRAYAQEHFHRVVFTNAKESLKMWR